MRQDPAAEAAVEIGELRAALQLATKLLGQSKANLNPSGRLAKEIRAFLDYRHKSERLSSK